MILMHENIPVAEVSMYLGNISAVKRVMNPEHLPMGTNHPGVLLAQYLNSWQRDRAIPFNRQSLDVYTSFFRSAPLEAAQVMGNFSMTDHYWFKEEGSVDKWEDLCFQKNGFSNEFSNFFLDMVSGRACNSCSPPRIPDANTDGVLPKMWIQDKNGPSLLKFGISQDYSGTISEYADTDTYHLLSANEVCCSKIADLMGINAVKYESTVLPGIPNSICKCSNFVPENMEFITLAQLAKEFAGQRFDLYEKICEMGFKKEVKDMLRFFFLIHNKDGHIKNCGFLRNAKTLQIEQFAPLFDHGCSLNFDGLGSSDQSVKPFRANRLEQIAMVGDIGSLPSFEEMANAIKDTYDEFNVPDTHLDLALEDLIETCNEWEKIAEKEEKFAELDEF